jgi:predicted MPP superfamily phosphohydrolase
VDKILIKQMLFYGSYLAFPFIAYAVWRMRKRGRRLVGAGLLAVSLMFVWARFVEPQMIRVRESTLSGTGIDADIVLISDIHLGIYKDRHFLDRIVDRINALPVDAVAIAGDLTYEPGQRSLRELFAPLARLRHPAYAVLGNHDQQAPGPDIDKALRSALKDLGVQVIEGDIIDTPAGWGTNGPARTIPAS